jgi:hypothetical protein
MCTGKNLVLAVTIKKILTSDKCRRIKKKNSSTAALLRAKIENVCISELLRHISITIQTMEQW